MYKYVLNFTYFNSIIFDSHLHIKMLKEIRETKQAIKKINITDN